MSLSETWGARRTDAESPTPRPPAARRGAALPRDQQRGLALARGGRAPVMAPTQLLTPGRRPEARRLDVPRGDEAVPYIAVRAGADSHPHGPQPAPPWTSSHGAGTRIEPKWLRSSRWVRGTPSSGGREGRQSQPPRASPLSWAPRSREAGGEPTGPAPHTL